MAINAYKLHISIQRRILVTHHDEDAFMNEDTFISSSLFSGRVVTAEYADQTVPSYCGNPLIEALPKEFTTDEEVAKALVQKPEFSPEMRRLSARDRIHCIGDVEDQFFQPLSHHLSLQLKISRMIRRGYVMRNPVTPGFYRHLQHDIASVPSFMEPQLLRRPKALGFNLIGPSGIGKSYALESILFLYPQVIKHQVYNNRRFTQRQLVWLKLDCPYDGLLSGLSRNFFEAVDNVLGTSYTRAYTKSKRVSVDDLLRAMARVAAIHFLGALVIDEIQVLRAMRGENSERMLNFFVNLVNTIGVPVLLIGTDKARKLFESKPRQARRGTGQGSEVWYLMHNDATWQVFLTSLFKFQYIQQPVKLTHEVSNALFEETQGITDLVVKLYVQSQIRSIRTGIETLTPNIVHSVALDSFQMLRPVIMALRNGDKRALAELEDIYPFWREEYARLAQQEDQPIDLTNQPKQPETTAGETQNEARPSQAQMQDPAPQGQGQAEGVNKAPSKSTSRSRRTKRSSYPSGSLMAIVENGKAQKITPYYALEQSGYIFSFDSYYPRKVG